MTTWKNKFKHLCTASGNLKRSITDKEAHQVFKYRVEEIGKVSLVEFYTRGVEKVQVKCNKCGYVWRAISKKVLTGTGCPLCFGNVSERERIQALQSLGNMPSYLLDKCPAHVAIKGVTEAYRGVRWFDFSRVYDDIFYIIYNREYDYYSFMTCSIKEFPDLANAALFIYGGDVSTEHVSKDYPTHLCYRSGYWSPFVWESSTKLEYPNVMWVTKYASLIKYCLEKKFKSRQYWPDPVEDPYAFRLTEQDIKLLNDVTDIEDVLSWDMS